jgi:Uncharacterised nucleotidyltransferase
MEPQSSDKQSARVQALMWNLRIDAAIGEVVRALQARGIASIVLKGPSLTGWYAPESSRTYDDGDLWVSPDDVDATEDLLRSLGFLPTADESGLPDWWLEHGSSWLRPSDRGKIDLHRRLQGVGAEPRRAWELLLPQSAEISVGGELVRCLPEHAMVMYAALHATHHGVDDHRGLGHLEAALATVDETIWVEAFALANALDAVEGFATALRLTAAGVAVAERIGVPDVSSTRTVLLASTPPPVALGFEQLSSARGLTRLHILVRKLVPPPGFIRHWWPRAASSRRMLIVGYLYRPLWLLQRAPAAYRAWRAARRAARSSS